VRALTAVCCACEPPPPRELAPILFAICISGDTIQINLFSDPRSTQESDLSPIAVDVIWWCFLNNGPVCVFLGIQK